jgi:AcrR family transcriptional regulator
MGRREDWLRAARRALRAGGIAAVRVEALARELAVTKGSFYWHFQNHGELLEALLASWEGETLRVITEASKAAAPLERVRQFFHLTAALPESPHDSAIFAWALADPGVAQRARVVEQQRLVFLREQLLEAGLGAAEAEQRAEVGYLAMLGWLERASRGPSRLEGFHSFLETIFQLLFNPALPAHGLSPEPSSRTLGKEHRD